MAELDFRVKHGIIVNENAQVLDTTDATSKDTGALIVEGGVGVEKNLHVGVNLTTDGNIVSTGDVAVNGGDLTSNQATFNFLNSGVTTINMGGSATSVVIGSTSGTTNIRNNLNVTGDLDIDGGDLTVSDTTFNLVNTTATTLNIGGAATSLNLGASTGTMTVNNVQTVFNSTDSIQIPVGNTSQRDQSPIAGQIRYNSQTSQFEGYGPGNAWGSLGGIKDVDGDTYILPELTPAGDQDTLYFYTGGTNSLSLNATALTLPTGTTLDVDNATEASSSTTGAVQIAGGVGIAKRLYVGGGIQGTNIGASTRGTAAFTTLTANNTVTFTQNTASTSTTSGTLQVTGGVGITGAIYAGATSSLNGLTTTNTTNLSPANANVTLSPTGTGTVTINPNTTGNMNNVVIGASNPKDGTFANLNTTGGLTINGSLSRGTFITSSNYVTGADNIVLKGNASGVSGIFFESESDGTNINHASDFGFIQFHAYGKGGSTGEANELIIGVSNDTDDHLILNAPSATGLKFRTLNGTTDYTVWHSGNDGSGSGLDADTTDGLQVHTARNNEANKIVRTDGSGYIQAGWINTTSGQRTTQAITRIYASDDDYIRYYNVSDFRNRIDVPTKGGSGASGTWAISISGNAATVTNGVYTTGNQSIAGIKTFTQGAGAITLSNSDIRSANANPSWTGNPGTVGKIQYHSNRWYIVADQNSNRIVQFRRDGDDKSYIDNDGRFQGNVTGSLSGNASTATTLQTARSINGTNFNGSANITTANWGTARTINGVSVNGSTNYTLEPYCERDDGSNASRYISFVDNNTAGYKRLNMDTNFYYNPSSNLLTVGALTETSSIAYKENINPINDALDKVLQLVGVTYDRKDSQRKNESGLIAEEVAQVIPSVVDLKDGNPESIQYSKLTAYLVECIKELNAKIERLEGKN